MIKMNVTAPKEYTDSQGQVKTTFPQVGKLVIWDAKDGKEQTATLELFMFPGMKYTCFTDKPRETQKPNSFDEIGTIDFGSTS